MDRALGVRAQPAFALLELGAVIAIMAVVAAVLSVAAGESRRQSRTGGSFANLQWFGATSAAYMADNQEDVPSFTWRAGITYTDGGYTFQPAATDFAAAANQAVAIIRRRAGRTDLSPITGWLPHPARTHLILADYADEPLPSRRFADPHDLNLLAWQRHHLQGYFDLPNRPAGNDNAAKRWPYSSSYEIGPAFFSPDASFMGVPTVAQSSVGHRYYDLDPNSTPLGRRRSGDVRFPSNKVMFFETFSRSFGAPELFFGLDDAPRTAAVMADTSSRVILPLLSNWGFQPNSPLSPTPTRIRYEPDLSWEPPTPSGNVADYGIGYCRWTRSGLRGRDIGGPEIPWAGYP